MKNNLCCKKRLFEFFYFIVLENNLTKLENQIRKKIPLTYLTIWDDLPYPMWNRQAYESCDALFSISKQTHNIVEHVLGSEKCIKL